MFRISRQVLRSYGLCTSWIVHSWASYVHKQVLQARQCWDNSLYPSFLQSPGLGFSKTYEESSTSVLEGMLFIFVEGTFL